MKVTYFGKFVIAAVIASTVTSIVPAGWTKELPDGTSVVIDTQEHSLKLLNNDVCIFKIQNVGSAAIHPDKNAIMMRGSETFDFKTIVKQDDKWREIQTPLVPTDSSCDGTRYTGTSCASRLFRRCKIFIIMLPDAVQIFEYKDFAWNELCSIDGATDVKRITNLSEQKVSITAEFKQNYKEFTEKFEYDRQNKELIKLLDEER